MPEVKKAQLIQGIVYMASPVSIKRHAVPDNTLQGLLFFYANSRAGLECASNGTVRLSPDDVIQPDVCLRKLPEFGGKTTLDDNDQLRGAPELVVEIANSSASIDLHDKKDSCRRAGVLEYIVWETRGNEFHWWALEDDDYRPLPQVGNCIESRAFPGLRLNITALKARDSKAALRTLQEALAKAAKTSISP